MIGTFQALVVAILAVLPGAAYTFAYERVAGSFGAGLADRLVRFLTGSAIFHALFAGLELLMYREFIATGSLARGEAAWWAFWLVTLGYVLLPTLAGAGLGYSRMKRWRWVRLLLGDAPEPRAWDYLWNSDVQGFLRIKLKSGPWIAGFHGTTSDGRRSYAAGYPEEGDLYLAVGLEIDPHSGELNRDGDGRPLPVAGPRGLLIVDTDPVAGNRVHRHSGDPMSDKVIHTAAAATESFEKRGGYVTPAAAAEWPAVPAGPAQGARTVARPTPAHRSARRCRPTDTTAPA